MNLDQLVLLTNEMVAKIEELDGHVFLDRFDEGISGLREKIINYTSVEEAQSWLNIVLFDQLISQIIGAGWTMDDPGVEQLLLSIEKAWVFQLEARFPHVRFSISKIIDPEYGDVGLKLVNVKYKS